MSVRRTRMPAGTPGTNGAAGASGLLDYIQLQDRETSGTKGGDPATGTWTTRVINTEVTDTGNHCSLTANQFVLDAGTYYADIISAFFATANTRLRLRNVTAGTTLLVNVNAYGGSSTQFDTSIHGRFTVAAAQTLEVQYWAESNPGGSNGLGTCSATPGETETYTSAQFWKIS